MESLNKAGASLENTFFVVVVVVVVPGNKMKQKEQGLRFHFLAAQVLSFSVVCWRGVDRFVCRGKLAERLKNPY